MPLSTVKFFITEFEKKLSGYSVKEYIIDEFTKVAILDDSLAILLQIVPYVCSPCLNAEEMHGADRKKPYLCYPIKGETYYLLHIEELTYNTLGLKYNHTKFIKEMEKVTDIQYLSLAVTYARFKGYTRLYWCKDEETNAEHFGRILPELKLRERYEAWEGVHYYFVVLELTDSEGNIERAVAYTTQKPHSYVIQLGNEWIKNGRFEGDAVRMNYQKFNGAFNSWKGISRQKRLESNLQYFYLEHDFREKDDVWRYADKILEDANNHVYDNEERGGYSKPINKWVSEELVYKIAKKLYKEYAVIYQHRPFFLHSSYGGQMSYDVFISGLDVAIEYQGRQHFEPVEFFGGKDAFEKLQQRDNEKMELSKQNGVKLVYINYWEEISPQLIRERVET